VPEDRPSIVLATDSRSRGDAEDVFGFTRPVCALRVGLTSREVLAITRAIRRRLIVRRHIACEIG
jgi:hypothetical protein